MKGLVLTGLMLCAGALFAVEPDYCRFISHRGESMEAPENTMPAFELAVKRGFGFECDIYLSADKRVFTFHDNNLKRTTGKDLPCSKASWEKVISKIDAGSWKGKQFKGVRPALLEELLTLARDGKQIYVEIKAGPEIIPYVKEIFAKQKIATPKNTLFICFSKAVCKALDQQMPEYKVYWLTAARTSWSDPNSRAYTAEEIIKSLKEVGADGVDICFDPVATDAKFVKEIQDAGYEVHCWTVNNLVTSLLAFERGIQSVTTDCALKQLKEYRQKRK